jgi:hypothetical protein
LLRDNASQIKRSSCNELIYLWGYVGLSVRPVVLLGPTGKCRF